jgi:DNA-binding SARP family transcriptional activator
MSRNETVRWLRPATRGRARPHAAIPPVRRTPVRARRTLEFRVLGPLELLENGRELPLGPPKQRAVLAFLLLHANDTVSTERLIRALWHDDPPETARTALHGHISRLRKLVGSDVLLTRPPGYVLRVDPDSIDAGRFERLAAGARAETRPHRRAEALHEALALWRGPLLADLVGAQFARLEAARLEEVRLEVVEERVAADLALGRHAEVVAELEALVVVHPLREELRRLLMLALFRSGRKAAALEGYRNARRTLVEELGLEPGEELRRLEQAILRHDAAPPGEIATDPLSEWSAELETLAQVVAHGSVDGPAAAVVVGEPGTGKSRLLTEAQQRLGPAHTLAVVGFEAEQNVPLAAAAPLLRLLAGTPHGGRLEQVLYETAAPLVPLLVFEAAHRAFRTLEPALLVVDDLQWIDELSLALCHHLVRAAVQDGQCLTVLVASRPGGASAHIVGAVPADRLTRVVLG